MEKTIQYMGVTITKKFPSGYYEFYSNKEGRYIKSDDLAIIKEKIKKEKTKVVKTVSLTEFKKMVGEIVREQQEYFFDVLPKMKVVKELSMEDLRKMGVKPLGNLRPDTEYIVISKSEPYISDQYKLETYKEGNGQLVRRLLVLQGGEWMGAGREENMFRSKDFIKMVR